MRMDERETLSESKHSQFIWFLLAFLVGLGLRLWRLGAMRFTLAEAQIAQSAWQMAMGDAAGLPGNMSYAGLSALLFHLFEPSFFFARLLPVLFGSSLILIPWFWRNELGHKTALVLAFGLAIDPILLGFSRQIVTPIFVLAGLAWAVTALTNKRPVLAGSMLALAFLGGYSFWLIALIGLAVFLIWRKRVKLNSLMPPQGKSLFAAASYESFIVSGADQQRFLLSTEVWAGLGLAGGVLQLFSINSKLRHTNQ